jgi:mercuric ion binding protein
VRTFILTAVTMFGVAMAHAAEPRTAVLDVANMTCPACRITIETALRRDAGVLATQVNTQVGTVSVRFDPDKTTEAHVAKTITDAGFPAKTHAHGD